jgi:hypothetical protein
VPPTGQERTSLIFPFLGRGNRHLVDDSLYTGDGVHRTEDGFALVFLSQGAVEGHYSTDASNGQFTARSAAALREFLSDASEKRLIWDLTSEGHIEHPFLWTSHTRNLLWQTAADCARDRCNANMRIETDH